MSHYSDHLNEDGDMPLRASEGEQPGTELAHPEIVDAELVVPAQPVMTFEGEYITDMEARVPAFSFPLESGYERNTHIRLNLEVRVKSISHDEQRGGDVLRKHVCVIEAAHMVVAYKPEDAGGNDIGGSASANATPGAASAEELGITIRRTGELWDNPEGSA